MIFRALFHIWQLVSMLRDIFRKIGNSRNGGDGRPKGMLVAIYLLAVLCRCSLAVGQPRAPEDSFLAWMTAQAQSDLQNRTESIKKINSEPDAERRKRLVRQVLLDEMGGLPSYHGPLNAKVIGELHPGAYAIEKLVYESLPGFYVPADLYRPNEAGHYPAVLLQAGHTQEGKVENQRIAANLVMKGFVVLCFDPIGEGEREQTYSRQLDAPLAQWSVPEHILLSAQTELVGQGLARYFLWDAMRSLDYLVSRPDVDASRIGAAGCSGGGALTTFLTALDERIKVAVPACYPSSLRFTFPTTGPHGEETFPRFLADGLDTADFIELSAPRPWLLQSNEIDQFGFSHEGVEEVYREAQRWYDLYGARNNLGFMVAPGSHGMPLESREALYQWMIRWLKNGVGDFHEQPVRMYSAGELQATPSGHVTDLPGSRKLHQLLSDELHDKEKPGSIPDLLAELRKLQILTDGTEPRVKVVSTTSSRLGTEQRILIESEPGVWIGAKLYLPKTAGRKPAVIVVADRTELNEKSKGTIAEKFAALGQVVLLVQPRTSQLKNSKGPYTGEWMSDLQANLIGRNLPAMRAHDTLRCIDLLRARRDVDSESIRGFARGVGGIWMLLAAAADPRLRAIWIDRTPHSLRAALDNSMTVDLPDAVIPGFILHWDLQDLVKAMGPRQVLWTDPTNWMERVVALGSPFRYRYVVGDSTDEDDVQDAAFAREFVK